MIRVFPGTSEVSVKKRWEVMDFYKRLHLAGQRIPYGRVASYGQLALLCGCPRNARQVGYALKYGLAGDFPAHRVVNSSGRLSGAPAFETMDMQRLLLEAESVEVADNKVDMKRFGWNNSFEDAISLAKCFEEEGI